MSLQYMAQQVETQSLAEMKLSVFKILYLPSLIDLQYIDMNISNMQPNVTETE